MERRILVTIAREYGSGGSAIGRRLAEKLGCPFYDKELLTLAARESGIKEDLFQQADEKPSGRFWEAMATGAGSFGNRHVALGELPMNDRLFLIQSDIIRKVAAQGSCVIVGRCADHILRDEPDSLRFFIHAGVESRLERIVNRYHVPGGEARAAMERIDRERAAYYAHHTQGKWGKAENYHLSVDSSVLGIDGTAELLLTFARMRHA